jgi:hypothetical protein
MSKNDLPPLPEVITKDIQSLRQVQPPPQLVEHAMAGLPDRATASASRKDDGSRKANSARHSMVVLMIPAAAIAAAIAFFVVGRAEKPLVDDMVRVEEKTVSLPESGHAWTALDLQMHHHADQPAVVHLEVPTHVRVRLPSNNEPNAEADERHCTEPRCVHRFTQHHGKGVPVRIAVTHPGRYEIHVRHESKKAALREHFVVTANRK